MQVNKYLIHYSKTLRESIKMLDLGGIGFIAVVDDDEMVQGIITDGDFRRAIMHGVELDKPCASIMNAEYFSLKSNYAISDVKSIFKTTKYEHIPIIESGQLLDILTPDIMLHDDKMEVAETHSINIPAVIMAGGLGSRMDPFTRILPKPLIPIGDKSMLEIIMGEYEKYNVSKYYISINHKGDMIKAYLSDKNDNGKISFIEERVPLGTAGALKYLDGMIDTPFFVSNCDIIIKDNYYKIYKHHSDNNNVLTLVASMRHYEIPYGVCEVKNGGELKAFVEKPKNDYLVNTGMYVLNPEILAYIPREKYFNMTHLIDAIRDAGLKVGVYPVSERSYIDVGEWPEYRNAVNRLTE
jgi:dTDP-glucose pyrophosphorylase